MSKTDQVQELLLIIQYQILGKRVNSLLMRGASNWKFLELIFHVIRGLKKVGVRNMFFPSMAFIYFTIRRREKVANQKFVPKENSKTGTCAKIDAIGWRNSMLIIVSSKIGLGLSHCDHLIALKMVFCSSHLHLLYLP